MKRRPFLGALAASALLGLTHDAEPAAQPPSARAPTRITLLGTGTPHPSLERQSSSYLVETGGDTILLDHGTGSHHRLLESGHKAVDVTHAFFTHLHYDHCMDYPRLVLQRWDQRAGVKTLVLVHAVPSIDQPRIREQIVHEIQQEFAGKVVWGEDLMQLTFAAPRLPTSGY